MRKPVGRGCLFLALGCALGVSAMAETALSNKPATSKPLNLEIVVQKAKKQRPSGTDYDNKSEEFQFNVRINNRDLTRDLTKLSASLYVYGKSVTREAYKLLDRASSTFDLPRSAKHEFHGEPIYLEYDNNEAAQFGVKYEGYVVVVKDASGQIVSFKAVKPSFLKNLDKLEKFKVGDAFDAKLEPLKHMSFF